MVAQGPYFLQFFLFKFPKTISYIYIYMLCSFCKSWSMMGPVSVTGKLCRMLSRICSRVSTLKPVIGLYYWGDREVLTHYIGIQWGEGGSRGPHHDYVISIELKFCAGFPNQTSKIWHILFRPISLDSMHVFQKQFLLWFCESEPVNLNTMNHIIWLFLFYL